MQVIETNIIFKNALTKRKTTKRIVVHHSASPANTTWKDIQRWHLGKGWSGIGYHYVIEEDGKVYRGRPEAVQGAHAYQDAQHEANSNGIGICLTGDFQIGTPTDAQLHSLVQLINDIHCRYPGIPVIGHKDVQATACPGKLFPWDELSKRLEDDDVLSEAKIKVNGKTLTGFILKDNKSYAPVRALAEALGAKVEWDEKTKTVIITQ